MLLISHTGQLQACSRRGSPSRSYSSRTLCRFIQRSSSHAPASDNSKASLYLAQRLNIHVDQLPAWENSNISELDVDRDLEPNINLLLEIESEQRVNALLRNHPELLGVPLNGWQNFLLQYGISSRFFFQLLRSHPRIFIQGSLYTAGQNMMFLQGIGLSNRDISAHIIPRAPEVLIASIKHTLLPVVIFLSTPLHIQHESESSNIQHDAIAQLPRGSIQDGDMDHLEALTTQPGMGLNKPQLRSVLSRCPGVLLMSVDQSLRPRFQHLWQSLHISKEEAQMLLYANTALLTSPIQPQIESHLHFLIHTCGITEEQARHVLVTCTDFVILSIGNLRRKWSYLVHALFGHETQAAVREFQASLPDTAYNQPHSAGQQVGTDLSPTVLARAAVLAYPPFFSKSLLAEIGPRYCYVQDKRLIHHLMAFNDQTQCVNLSLEKLLDGNTQQFLTCVHGDEADFAQYIEQWRKGKAGLLTVTGNNVIESSW